jgi:carbon-monoxide dehydrogenase medium subunit
MSARYVSPLTVSEAIEVLSRNPDTARVLAGGTDLIVLMRLSRQIPELIVDIKNIPQTREITLTGGGLVLGAAVPSVDLTEHPEVPGVYPGLVEAAELIGSTQIQSRASLGGNLCHSSPAADTVPALAAVRAQCRIAGPAGERRVAVEDFCTGPGANVLGAGEFLVAFEIPHPGAGSADAYLRFIPRNEMDIAVVGSGVSVTLDGGGTCTAARVALGAVAPTMILVPESAAALVGSRIEDADLERAAAAASAAARPINDRRGTVEFRRHVVGVLTRRAAAIARDRARAAA